MALKITNLKIDSKSLVSTMLLADISSSYEYKYGEHTDKLEVNVYDWFAYQ